MYLPKLYLLKYYYSLASGWILAMWFINDPFRLKNNGQCLHCCAFEGFMPWTFALCLFKMNWLHISWPHSSHFTLSWTSCMCVFSRDLVPKLRVHWLHWNGVLFSCSHKICSFKLKPRKNFLSQNLHWKSFLVRSGLLEWTLSLWVFNLCFSMKTLGHSSHINFSLSTYSGGKPPWTDWWCCM